MFFILQACVKCKVGWQLSLPSSFNFVYFGLFTNQTVSLACVVVPYFSRKQVTWNLVSLNKNVYIFVTELFHVRWTDWSTSTQNVVNLKKVVWLYFFNLIEQFIWTRYEVMAVKVKTIIPVSGTYSMWQFIMLDNFLMPTVTLV